MADWELRYDLWDHRKFTKMNKDQNFPIPPPPAWWPAIVYFVLIVVGIPWYWPNDNYVIIFGMPGWVIIAIGASIICSIFTALLLHSRLPRDSNPSEGEDPHYSSDIG